MNAFWAVPLAVTLIQTAASPAAPIPPDSADDAARRSLHLQPTVEPIRIDGELNDPGWAGAARTTGFLEFNPGDGVAPPVATEVLVTYDADHLYVGFIAQADPRRIRASLRDRDDIYQDDHVGILLDTYGDATWGYFLLANPYGVQGDIRFTANGEDPTFDIIFETEAEIVDDGYRVEFAIPFSSLRFPDRDEQRWRVNFYRNLPRSSRHQLAWAPLDRGNPCLLCQSGDLTGVRGVRAGGQLELLPSMVAHQAGTLTDPAAAFETQSVQAEASLGMRYASANGWTAEATYNPDFSQVEADAAQIDVNTTFALSYPERRPFFQEGGDLLDTWVTQVYTRSINAPRVAAKLTGRAGRTSVAYVGALDEHTPYVLPFEERSAVLEGGRSTSNIVRLRRGLYEDSYIGALLTDRRVHDGGSGSTLGVDAMLRLGTSYVLEMQLVGSYTREPDDPDATAPLGGLVFGRGADPHTAAFDGESFAGRASYLSLERQADLWGFDIDYWDATPTFRADNGFQTRNDFRRTIATTWLDLYPDADWIDHVSPMLQTGSVWNFDGENKERWIGPRVSVRLKGQTQLGVGLALSRERFGGVDFDGLRRIQIQASTAFSEPVQFGGSFSHGGTIARTTAAPRRGTGTNLSGWARLKPTDRLSIRPEYAFATLRDPSADERLYSGYILRSRVSYQFTRGLFLRLVAQYDDFGRSIDVDPLLSYKLNPYSIFYVGSTHDFRDFGDVTGVRQTERQIFLKIQYLFRR